MNKDLEAVDWTYFYSCRHVNEACSIMKNIFSSIFDRHAPKLCKNIRGQPSPWLNSDLLGIRAFKVLDICWSQGRA